MRPTVSEAETRTHSGATVWMRVCVLEIVNQIRKEFINETPIPSGGWQTDLSLKLAIKTFVLANEEQSVRKH